jgi:CelD/BcsL family acetyltransferase involved in cellulose biosynthesis
MAPGKSADWSGQVVPGEVALGQHRGEWLALLERSGAHPTFNGPDWLSAQRAAFDLSNERLVVLEVRRGQRLTGWLPLVREAQRPAPFLRRARLLGDGSFDSDYLEPLLDPDGREHSAACLVDTLARCRLADYAILRTLPKGAPAVQALLTAWGQRRWPLRQEQKWACRAALGADFEGYVQSLKPRMRSKVRQALRRSAQAGWRFESLPLGASPAEWVAELFALHQARWIEAGEPGAFADARRCQLYRQAFDRFAENGQARIDRLVGPSGTVAIQAGFDAAGAYHQLQEGYLPELSQQRPGVALRALAIQAAIGRGIHNYDFLGGNSSHKTDWGGQLVELTTLTLPLGSWRGRFLVRALCRRQAQAAAQPETQAAAEPDSEE